MTRIPVDERLEPQSGAPLMTAGAYSASDGKVLPLAGKPIGDGSASISVGGLVPEEYDEIALSYTASNLTGVVFKRDGETIATLTLTYSGSDLIGVVRT